jgi:metal-responsive CopG/Arc/MetJ family transcriptional regulator
MKKIAITLPDDQAKAVERIRKQKRIPRSRVIQQALAYYLSEQALLSAVREYEEGYRRRPEDAAEAEAYGKAAAEVLAPEDWE